MTDEDLSDKHESCTIFFVHEYHHNVHKGLINRKKSSDVGYVLQKRFFGYTQNVSPRGGQQEYLEVYKIKIALCRQKFPKHYE